MIAFLEFFFLFFRLIILVWFFVGLSCIRFGVVLEILFSVCLFWFVLVFDDGWLDININRFFFFCEDFEDIIFYWWGLEGEKKFSFVWLDFGFFFWIVIIGCGDFVVFVVSFSVCFCLVVIVVVLVVVNWVCMVEGDIGLVNCVMEIVGVLWLLLIGFFGLGLIGVFFGWVMNF